jgi:hypothetical protein
MHARLLVQLALTRSRPRLGPQRLLELPAPRSLLTKAPGC